MTDAGPADVRHVKVSSNADLRSFPDFLIVGPQRTGTTWLHAHLRYHPQIMLSEPKEIFFFSSLARPDSPRYRSNELSWYLRFFHEPWWRLALRNAISLWRYRERYRPRVRGEATASYAALSPEIIREITMLKPDIKVILMIRNPIDRAWSHAKKDLVRNRDRKFADVSAAEFEQFFRDPYQRQCARYVENIDNWSASLRPDHLLVGLFDDVYLRPEALLLEVMRFLGVVTDRRYISAEVRQRVNPTESSTIPEQYRRFLEELLEDDVRALRERFGLSWGPPQSGGQLQRTTPRAAAHHRFVFALEEH